MQRSVREPRVHTAVCILALALACGGKSTPAPATATIQAEAGPDQAVVSGALVTLGATVTTNPAGLAVSYAWSQVSGTAVTLSSTAEKNPTFTAPALPSGQRPSALVFSLVASASTATSAASSVTVTVSPAPAQHADPVANAGADQAVTSGAAVTLDGRGSVDPQGAPLTFAWTQSSGAAVALTGAGTSQPAFTAPTVADGSPAVTLVFSLVVSDSLASSAPASVIVTVNSLSTASFPPPPGTPPPASPTPTPLPVGGNGSNRFEMGAAQ
ncbi:MAG TPA: PKD domain-containing protein, partial [Myxococcales bacterium]|nr:PKD domain-containing protein [Myxococcales bacterium]